MTIRSNQSMMGSSEKTKKVDMELICSATESMWASSKRENLTVKVD